MNKYKIKSINRDNFFMTDVITTKGEHMSFSTELLYDAKVGDVIREYVEKYDFCDLETTIAYSCNGNFWLTRTPRIDSQVRYMFSDMSYIERGRMNVALMRALIKKKIVPTLSLKSNVRLLLARDRVNLR